MLLSRRRALLSSPASFVKKTFYVSDRDFSSGKLIWR